MLEAWKQRLDAWIAANGSLHALYFENPSPLVRLGAFLLPEYPDQAALRHAKALVLQLEDRFDGLSRQLRPILTAASAGSEEPEALLLGIADTYEALKRNFLPSPHLITAAMAMQLTPCGRTQEGIKALHEAMRQAHPWLTGLEDVPACAMLPCGVEASHILSAEEKLCSFEANAAQGLSLILARHTDPLTAAEDAIKLEKALRAEGIRAKRGCEALALGALADLPPEQTALAAAEVRHYLGRESSLGFFAISARERTALSLLLTGLLSSNLGIWMPLFSCAAFYTEDSMEGALLREET